jgi:transcriptional regulator with XRE-family HTH domain
MKEINTKQTLEQEISSGITELHDLLDNCSTQSVAGCCFSYHLKTEHADKSERRLTSPAKQIPFLLAVLLSRPEPANPRDFGKTEWEQAKSILERLFSAYMFLYMPTKKQLGTLAPEWYRVREVSMLAFLHYFNNGLLASVQQIAERVKVYLVPFDTELSELLGINASESIAICQWISDRLQKTLDELQEVARAEHEQRIKLIGRAEREKWSLEALKSAAQDPGYAEKIQGLFSKMNALGIVQLPELQRAFPRIADAFWRQFSVRRGDALEIRYPTERSIFETSPLININDTEAFCPAVNYLFTALLLECERTLLQSPVRKRYLRARDKALEDETLRTIRAFLSPEAAIWSEVYETPDSHFEHDIIAVDNGLCLVIEAKAAPPIEPFRDPDKAFVRLRDAFRADTGIQKAYEQANRIVRKLKDGHVVPLYNGNGQEVTRLLPDPSRLQIAVCVTRDNFGALATNLKLLLEKDGHDSYPWAVNIIDLVNLAEAWSYLRWGPLELRKYLEQRILLHGKVFSDDELDYTGFFLRHGDFSSAIKTQADLLQLNPDYSSVFDELYRHLHLGGPPVKLKQTEPVLMDLKRSLISGQPEFVDAERCNTTTQCRKIGRNEQCPCGSGKKFKRCCGVN